MEKLEPFSREELMRAVLNSDNLPSLPTVASQLVTMTADEDATLADIADLVSQDVALSTKVLKVANSAFYNFPQQIGSVAQALSILGTKAVQSLVLSFSFMSLRAERAGRGFDFDRYVQRSIAQASMTRLIQERAPCVDSDEAFIAGLLQNLGELVIACTLPEKYEMLTAEKCPLSETIRTEHSVLGCDHCHIGYEVAKTWNFPSSITLPIRYHHAPLEYVGNDEKTGMTIRAVHLADLLVGIFHAEDPGEIHSQFRKEAVELLKLGERDIDGIVEEAHREMDRVAASFGLQVEETRPVLEILQEANIRLSLLHMDSEQMNKELIKTKIALEKLTRELQEKNEQLKKLAEIDELTQVYNNRYFHATLDREVSRTNRQGYSMSLVLIDIDHFKRFNDEHGHLVGDFVLAQFSRVIAETVREYDTFARYGGEEFALILPETDEEAAIQAAEKLRSAIENASFRQDGKTYQVTASFGLIAIEGQAKAAELDKQAIIKMADEALYDAKKRGRNRVAVYRGKRKWYNLINK
ncbi:MAG: GGDEF domain-containing protein [Halioglobus sp.]|nr:GGDEF domain-containing protein [Halioglobus sp.]|tara:strand:+ start:3301 stop:4878 length:1578 start_codon:yes stop_codon:yes gene_type:complete